MAALEKPLSDEAIEQVPTEAWIETPQSRGLRNREREAGHFRVLTANALERVVVLTRTLAVQRRRAPLQRGCRLSSELVASSALNERTLSQLSRMGERSIDRSQER